MPKRKYYAVASGRKTGIFNTWEECKAQVHGCSGAKYKSFKSLREAQDFLSSSGSSSSSGSATADGTRIRIRASKPPLPMSSNHTSKESGETSRKRPRTDTLSATQANLTSISKKSYKGSSSIDDNNDGDGVQVRIMFDGGARGNPGIAGAGAVVTIVNTCTTKTIHIRDFVGTNFTNNQAEYQGLLTGLNVAWQQCRSQQKKMVKLIVQGDSQLIIRQLKGEYDVKSKKLKPLYEQAQQLLQQIKTTEHSCPAAAVVVVLEHVYRTDNKLADQLANEAMDAQRSWMTTSDDNHQKQHTLDSFLQHQQETQPKTAPDRIIDV